MKVFALSLFLLLLNTTLVFAQQTCLEPTHLKDLDNQWESALLTSNVDFLSEITAEDFVWVHNHAGTIDTKTDLIERAADPNRGATGSPRSRTQSGVEVRILGSTGVVTGFTLVDRGPTPTRYSFMRTYVEVEGRCVLLANQTMASPTEED